MACDHSGKPTLRSDSPRYRFMAFVETFSEDRLSEGRTGRFNGVTSCAFLSRRRPTESIIGYGVDIVLIIIGRGPPVRSVRLGQPFVSKGCHAKAHRAKAVCASRELRPGRPPCDHPRKDSRKADGVLAPTKYRKQPSCKATWVAGMDCFYPRNILTRRAITAPFHHRTICKTADGRCPFELRYSIHSGSSDSALVNGFTVQRLR